MQGIEFLEKCIGKGHAIIRKFFIFHIKINNNNNTIRSEEKAIIGVIDISCIRLAINLHNYLGPSALRSLEKKRRIRSFIVSCRGAR